MVENMTVGFWHPFGKHAGESRDGDSFFASERRLRPTAGRSAQEVSGRVARWGARAFRHRPAGLKCSPITNYPCQSLTRHYQMDLPGPLLLLCARGNARFRLQTPGQRPGGPKAISYHQFARIGQNMGTASSSGKTLKNSGLVLLYIGAGIGTNR